jgi:WD40 repeat protein
MTKCNVTAVPGGELLLLRTFNGLRLVDARSGTLRHKLEPYAREPVALSSDGRLLAAAVSNDSAIAVWDVASGELRKTFVTDHGRVSALAFDASGRRLLSGGYDGTALVWDVATK